MQEKVTVLPELSRQEMLELLEEERVCRIGLNDRPQPYVVPTDFAYHNGVIYIHTPGCGRKARLAREDPHVCLEVDRYNASVTEYRSVIVRGLISEVTDKEEKIDAMSRLAEKAVRSGHPGRHGNEARTDMMPVSVFRIEIKDMTGIRSPQGGHP